MSKSPLEELHIPADDVWKKVAPGYVLTIEDVRTIVQHEREQRAKFVKKSAEKKVKREEKANDE